jgi:hypothetical protein
LARTGALFCRWFRDSALDISPVIGRKMPDQLFAIFKAGIGIRRSGAWIGGGLGRFAPQL